MTLMPYQSLAQLRRTPKSPSEAARENVRKLEAHVEEMASRSRRTSSSSGTSPSRRSRPLGAVGESRNRPHSYSGGLSSTDLVRLQQAAGGPGNTDTWTSSHGTPERKQQADQPTYPSLLASHNGSGTRLPEQQLPGNALSRSQEEIAGDFQTHPTNFGAYPAPVHPGAMPVANPQQELYNMMLPRQCYHGTILLRILLLCATLLMLNNAFAAGQMYAPAMAPPALSMFSSQFYGAPGAEPYPSPEIATAQMTAQLQAQYTGSYGVPLTAQSMTMNHTGSSHTNANGGNGPSAKNRKLGLYKTELCRTWEEKGSCRYRAKCQFAHGEEELRKVERHPKTFWVFGSCPYGKRCCFIHTELPASGGPPGADGTPPPANPDGRARSSSTKNEVSSSLLARISAKRTQDAINSGPGSVSTTPPSATVPNTARLVQLRVNTDVADPSISKQNKSAYPTFVHAHNGILMASGEDATARSPGPVTAGPDYGRHASSRLDIVGSQRGGPKIAVNPSVRHSFNGSDIQLDLSSVTTTPTAANPSSQLNASPEPPKVARINGHVRSGSAGNWATATRTANHLTAYPLSSIPGGELKTNSPWADYNVGSLRLAEKNWA
ncbi:hypothetical protein C8Q76DRAFT_810096 [Earliella scabrosa]|nr:hypothetical protein C8Q76DRAFT_810096 [Earliella scabrosa]